VESTPKARRERNEARRVAHRRLGEGLTEGSYRVHRSSERGSPRLVENTQKLGEGLTEGSERGSPKARRGTHRRLVESAMKLGEWLTEGSERGSPKARRGSHRRLEWYTPKCHVYHSIPLCTILVGLFHLSYIQLSMEL
jgi:hypothetical protein